MPIRSAALGALALLVLAACGGGGERSLVLLEPYRGAGDPCRRVEDRGDGPRFMGDLVACPDTMPGLARFAAEVRGIAVDRVPGYVLYAVPRR